MKNYNEEIKIICCDVDGTLLRNDKSLSEENIKWIQKAVNEKNIRFLIVSGRMPYSLRQMYKKIGIKGPVSCYSGGCLYDEDDNIISEHRMSLELAQKVIEAGYRAKVNMVFFDNQDWYMESRDNYTYQNKKKAYITECKIGNIAELGTKIQPNKILTVSENPEDLKRWENEIRALGLSEKEIVFYPNPNFLEIMPRTFNKGTAIKELSSYYNISISSIMAIGDDYNDIEMLKEAGLGIAMANSVQEAKDVAYEITASNEEDGVATAIKKYVFNMDI
ncbi:MAG: HAD family hydrolase [Sphaerochaetaceae bacterium]|nr:HAD family hydrolase [Sphaerochaetaceae bacterium]